MKQNKTRHPSSDAFMKNPVASANECTGCVQPSNDAIDACDSISDVPVSFEPQTAQKQHKKQKRRQAIKPAVLIVTINTYRPYRRPC